jgi:hypothetical protein
MIVKQAESSKYVTTQKGLIFLAKWMELQELLVSDSPDCFVKGKQIILPGQVAVQKL